MRDERQTTVVATSTDIVAATAWRDLLRDAGIKAEILGGGMSWVYPGQPTVSDYRVIVFEDDAARARELIDRAESGELRIPGDE